MCWQSCFFLIIVFERSASSEDGKISWTATKVGRPSFYTNRRVKMIYSLWRFKSHELALCVVGRGGTNTLLNFVFQMKLRVHFISVFIFKIAKMLCNFCTMILNKMITVQTFLAKNATNIIGQASHSPDIAQCDFFSVHEV